MFHETIREYEIILNLDPEQYKYIRRIGKLYQEMGELDSAMIYHQKYAEQFPKDYLSYKNIGEIHLIKADFEKAKENLEKALLLETGAISLLISIADIELQTGHFDLALDQYLQALNFCKSAADSTRIYDALDEYYELIGQIGKSIEYYELRQNEIQKFASPLNFQINNIFFANKYVKAGNPEKALGIIEKIKKSLQPPMDKVASFGYMFYYIELKDAEKAESYITEANDLAVSFGEEMLQINILFAEAKINEIKGNFELAIEKFKEYLEARPNEFNTNSHIAKCYRLNGDYDKAEEYLSRAFKHFPFRPKNNLEMGLIYLEQGKKQKAKEYLRIANDIWKDADPDFEPALEAKTKLQELESI